MTYVVTEKCIRCKYMDCVKACPVDCFYEGENMLVIHPAECIDCGACEPECPSDAILRDTETEAQKFLELNEKYSNEWPVIRESGKTPDDADEWLGLSDKFENFFSPNPGPNAENT